MHSREIGRVAIPTDLSTMTSARNQVQKNLDHGLVLSTQATILESASAPVRADLQFTPPGKHGP